MPLESEKLLAISLSQADFSPQMAKINGTKTLPYQPPQPQTNKTCNTVPRNFYKKRLPEDSGSLFLRSTLFQRRLRRFPLQMPLHIAGKRFSVRQHLGAEHAPAQESGQVYIERAKMLSHGVFAAVGQQGLQGMQRGIEIAVAEGTAPIPRSAAPDASGQE